MLSHLWWEDRLAHRGSKVLLGATLLRPGAGGISAVARMSARALIGSGVRVDLLSFLDTEPVEVDGVAARLARGSKFKFLLAANRLALRNPFALYDSVGTARAHPRALRRLRPYATWIHGIEVWYDDSPARARALAGADIVLVNSAFTLEKFETLRGPLPRAQVCGLSTESDDAPDALASFQGPPSVLILGRIDAAEDYKGHRELIAAWPQVTAAVPQARLVIAGGGSGLDAIQAVAAASPARENIDVLGFVPEEALPALWDAAHVFAMPSRNEGFGIVYAEAMRRGLPVVASIHDAGREVNVDGVTGFNADLDRKDDLADRLIFLLRNTDKAAAMGLAGHSRWQRNFRFSDFATRLNSRLDNYLSISAGGPAGKYSAHLSEAIDHAKTL
ncbi:glycosyl transferase group 1 [Rhodomicrobium vannielii ATCC 17100]|uniref:Glycosyl transferase group 1 n=1 Tax=Rhodomicrobium vannielii (strain ATCC 17100 / DSM 162 / LMG 4299 / NCIMB 10020 / ATH 3.1.1) TaxID=648757 RepID=E3I5M3_RHOVT|nr:glycosyltransferase family 4 protein [Rhodomicrobium vannielii]ADP72834.1 glycosyl transferase group 1 [Rhodomicrobium vannielii ATCC 17100]